MASLTLASSSYVFNVSSISHCYTRDNTVIRRIGTPSLGKACHITNCAKGNSRATATTDTVTPLVKDIQAPRIPDHSTPPPTPTPVIHPDRVRRSDFPPDFLFGAGSSALQTEGAYQRDGRGPSVWDVFTKAKNMASIDVADDSYDLYPTDIQLLKDMGANSYRFSISWTRILPKGNLAGGINQLGIDHYNKVIDLMIQKGIQPFVTIFHFDLPQGLEDLYKSVLSREFVKDFVDYCDICFRSFGDRVKYWALTNEMFTMVKFGYDLGLTPPGRGSLWYNCSDGDSTTEPYRASHNLILAQGYAARLYKDKYQATQKGQVGISIVANWFLPCSDSHQDQLATNRAREFEMGWFLGPLCDGAYPASMQYLVKDRLPLFTPEDIKIIKGSLDFIGVNYYTTNYVRNVPFTGGPPTSYSKDSFTETVLDDSRGAVIGPEADGSNFSIYPDGLRQVLLYLNQEYKNQKFVVTENGVARSTAHSETYATGFRDRFRAKYMRDHIVAMKQAIEEGVNVKGYFYWSLLDSFELVYGYNLRYGLNYTDFQTLSRDPKLSAEWYTDFLKGFSVSYTNSYYNQQGNPAWLRQRTETQSDINQPDVNL